MSGTGIPAGAVAGAALPGRAVGGGVAALIERKRIVIACGSGGVGKTTTAAALGAAVATTRPGRVLVMTVDPARRLADALGLVDLGNEVTQVDPRAFVASGATARGELWVAMLDTKASWDSLVRRHAPDRATTEEILANPLYRNITGRFAQSHEYIAMERLYELDAEGRFDLIAVDTPPAQGALDLLDAPQKMADFFSSRLLRWLTAPMRSRLVGLASRPFTHLADRVLGTEFLEDIARFFVSLQSMYGGFVDRAEAVSRLLRAEETTFMVVTTPESSPVAEARDFVSGLSERGLHLGVLVANKVLPPSLSDPAARAAALAMVDHAAGLAAGLGDDPAALARVLSAVGRSFGDFGRLATRQDALLHELARAHEVSVQLPHAMGDVVDLAGLLDMGRLLLGA